MIRLDRYRRGGEPAARVREEWVLTRAELAGLLITGLEPGQYGDLRELTRTEIEAAIRQVLSTRADKRHWWGDLYRDEYDGEPTADEVEKWAMAQISKLPGGSEEKGRK